MQQAATCQRLCHAACQGKIEQAARQSLATINHSDIPGLSCRLQKNSKRPASPNESTQSKEVGPLPYSHIPPSSYRPNPPACKRAARPEYRPCCLKSTATRTKNHPPWDGLKICQFAFLHKGRSLPRSTLCSSLPPLHKKFAWHGEALVPPGNG